MDKTNMTDVVIKEVEGDKGNSNYWMIVCMSKVVESTHMTLKDAEIRCGECGYTYEVIELPRYKQTTANLLAAHDSLKLNCIENHKLDTVFSMKGINIAKRRQAVRDYTKRYNIKILNDADFNWPTK